MMTVDEDLIERYVRYRGTLTERDSGAAEDLLRTSGAARELARFFASFYEEFDGLKGHNGHHETVPREPAS